MIECILTVLTKIIWLVGFFYPQLFISKDLFKMTAYCLIIYRGNRKAEEELEQGDEVQ